MLSPLTDTTLFLVANLASKTLILEQNRKLSQLSSSPFIVNTVFQEI